MAESKNFINEVDALGRSLMTAAKGTKTDLGDKIAIFANMVKWAAIKNKIEPDEAEGSGWAKYGRVLNNGAGRAGNSPASAKPQESQRSRPAPVDDAAAAASDRASAEKDASRQFAHLGNLECDGVDPKPAFGSFPLPDGGLRSGDDGGDAAGADAPGGGSHV